VKECDDQIRCYISLDWLCTVGPLGRQEAGLDVGG
jgi:hypothetical protein